MASAWRELVILRISTALLWAALAACAVYWGLQWGAERVSQSAPGAPVQGPAPVDVRSMARLLGGGAVETQAAAQAVVASRFSLQGVIDVGGRQGIALIGVDGKPAKPFRLGTWVEPGLMLQRVEPRRVHLGPDAQAPSALTIDLPPPRRAELAPGSGPQVVPAAPAVAAPQGRFDAGSMRPEAGATPAVAPPAPPRP